MTPLTWETPTTATVRPLLLVGSDPLLADLAVCVRGRFRPRLVQHLTADQLDAEPCALVLSLGPRLTPQLHATLAVLAQAANVGRVCLVSSFRAHLGDRAALEVETAARAALAHLGAKVVVFRPGHVVGQRSRLTGWLQRLSWSWPLIPARFSGCCVETQELTGAIDDELDRSGNRTFTLLGPNLPWRERLRAHNHAFGPRTLLCFVLGVLQIGQLLGLLFSLLTWVWPRLRAWNVGTLNPSSPRELLELVNPYNQRHIKVVGYNNGVIHFGQRHDGKTVVVTAGCHRVARVRGDCATFDAGVTVRQASEALAVVGKELHVVPNYSYVCLGTAFFVPIHGSASAYSTLGDTIDKAVLYDPMADLIVVAKRGGQAFGNYLYNLQRPVLLLRLTVRVKEKSRYYVEKHTHAATGQELIAAFHDPRPSNVEVRKASGASREATVYRYYTMPDAGTGEALAFPRDAVGRLWDRLHENPLTSAVFHGLTRHLAYHVEVFFTEEEFVTFWETHHHLPIAKIQLRYIKRDGQAHSPFRDHDCVSADLFMLKRHKAAFDRYIQETFRHAQFNPGKHSR